MKKTRLQVFCYFIESRFRCSLPDRQRGRYFFLVKARRRSGDRMRGSPASTPPFARHLYVAHDDVNLPEVRCGKFLPTKAENLSLRNPILRRSAPFPRLSFGIQKRHRFSTSSPVRELNYMKYFRKCTKPREKTSHRFCGIRGG